MTVTCPKCGSIDIREKNTAYAELPVTLWNWDEEEGAPVPACYETDVACDWETREFVADQYICNSCRWSGDLSALTVVREGSTMAGHATNPEQPTTCDACGDYDRVVQCFRCWRYACGKCSVSKPLDGGVGGSAIYCPSCAKTV